MDDFLVYQMGKVGSTSIRNALVRRGYTAPKIHWLAHKFPEGEFFTRYSGREELIKNNKLPPLKVVSSVREPMARNISAFFQRLLPYVPNEKQADVDHLMKVFLNDYNIEYPDEWFEKELKGVLGFDPYQETFDPGEGYKIYKSGKNKLIIFKLEDLSRVFSRGMREAFNLEGLKIGEDNVYSSKHKGHRSGIYEAFRSREFPLHFLDRVYDLKYANHFYSEEELERFKEKWSKPGWDR